MVVRAEICAYFDDIVGKIDGKIYGHFAEHLGLCVYGGMYVGEQGEIPSINGWRRDVMKLVEALNPPIVRWPGGCFSEYYHWEDGIGPVKDRPLRINWIWHGPEPNMVGTHEFMEFCKMVRTEPLVVVNVRTGTPEEAARWVEYCNSSPEKGEGIRRARNGHPNPFNVKYWGVGNEAWDLGAEHSAKRFVEYAETMREADPQIKLVAVGGHASNLEEWNEAMMKIAGGHFDYIAPHHYDGVLTPGRGKREEAYYANVASSERIVKTAATTADQLDKFLGNRPDVGVALDEWGIWTQTNVGLHQNYNLSDGLVAAAVLNGLQKLCIRVKMACWAQLVNVIGMIQANQQAAWPTPIYHIFRLYGTLCGDLAVKNFVDCGAFDAPRIEGRRGELSQPMNQVPFLDASATKSSEDDRFVIAIVNRHIKREVTCQLNISGLLPGLKTRAYTVNAPDVFTFNTFQERNAISITEKKINRACKSYKLPAHSVTILTYL